MKKRGWGRDQAAGKGSGGASRELMQSVTSSSAIEVGVTRAREIERALKHPTVADKAFLTKLFTHASLSREGHR